MKLNAFCFCTSENGNVVWLHLPAVDTVMGVCQQVGSAGCVAVFERGISLSVSPSHSVHAARVQPAVVSLLCLRASASNPEVLRSELTACIRACALSKDFSH